MVDVAARDADVAVRLARSTSSVLVEKHLASFRFGLFASEEYVRRHLPTRRLALTEAGAHSFVGLVELGSAGHPNGPLNRDMRAA